MSEEKKKKRGYTVLIVIVVILALLLVFNLGKIIGRTPGTSGRSILPSVSASEIIPKGTPKTYGSELGISYNDVTPTNPSKADAAIGILTQFDRTITLTENDKQRYINIASQISCEYCCGVGSIIFTKDTGQYKKGDAACGCAHSYAMRGLAKYLIKNHPTEFTDNEILEELGKWKVLFFPDIHETKASILKSKGIDTNYINLASNKYRGIEKGQTSGGMVGGC